MSDRTLKENIQPLQSSLDKIISVEGVEYDWKDPQKYGHRHQIGLIAQDLEKIYPEVVVTDHKTGLKSVAYDHLIAPVIEAIKELDKRLSTLFSDSLGYSRELAALKIKNQILEAKVKEIDQIKINEENLKLKNEELENRMKEFEKVLKANHYLSGRKALCL